MKYKLTTLYLVIIAMICITIHSCKKDNTSEKTSDRDQEQIRDWYNSKVNRSGSNHFNTLKPVWESVSVQEQSGQLVYEMKMNNPNHIFVGVEATDKNKAAEVAPRASTRLVVFKDKKTGLITRGCYMSVINEGASADLNSIHYKQFNNFTGKIYYFDMNGRFGNGWAYMDGLVSGRITASTKENYLQSQKELSGFNKKSPNGRDKLAREQGFTCFTAMIEYWGSTCVDSYGCEYYITGVSYITSCTGPSGLGGEGGEYGGGGGGGADGGVGNVPPAIPKVDVDPAARPCLAEIKTALEALGLKSSTSDGTGLIASVLNKLNLSTGPNFNAIITEGGIDNGFLADTKLITNQNSWGSQGFVSQIKFSSVNLNKMTDLKVAATMIHEYVHAYFDWNAYLIRNGKAGADPGFQEKYTLLFDTSGNPMPDDLGGSIQHKQMAESFVTEISKMLKKYAEYKEIPMPADQEYFNKMAWGGLLRTPAGKLAPEGTQYTLSAEQGTTGTTITQQTKCKQ